MGDPFDCPTIFVAAGARGLDVPKLRRTKVVVRLTPASPLYSFFWFSVCNMREWHAMLL
jgi:hypothetical protein